MALWRWTRISSTAPSYHEIAIGAWTMTDEEKSTGLNNVTHFEQFWCVFLDNNGNDCLTDVDTQNGFWTNVYSWLAVEAGIDTSHIDPLMFNADVHNLTTYADVTEKFHGAHKLWLEPIATNGTCVFSSTPTDYPATVSGEWKRCHNENFNDGDKGEIAIAYDYCLREFFHYFPYNPSDLICGAGTNDDGFLMVAYQCDATPELCSHVSPYVTQTELEEDYGLIRHPWLMIEGNFVSTLEWPVELPGLDIKDVDYYGAMLEVVFYSDSWDIDFCFEDVPYLYKCNANYKAIDSTTFMPECFNDYPSSDSDMWDISMTGYRFAACAPVVLEDDLMHWIAEGHYEWHLKFNEEYMSHLHWIEDTFDDYEEYEEWENEEETFDGDFGSDICVYEKVEAPADVTI